MAAQVTLSRPSYERVMAELLRRGLDEATVRTVQQAVCETLRFDPTARRYNERVCQQKREWRARQRQAQSGHKAATDPSHQVEKGWS